jgi:histidinol-phosphate phosphatase family protein
VAGLAAGAAGRRAAALVAGALWAAGTAELALARIRPGPRTVGEVADMLATSTVLPLAASYHWLTGWARLPALLRDADRAPLGQGRSPLAVPYPTVRGRRRFGPVPRGVPADPHWTPEAILFDRDGTLVVDVPYNGDPERVVLMPGARMAVARARRAGLAVGVVSNQSGVARGLLTEAQVEAVNRRVDELAGPFDVWEVCPHGPDDGCGCRKPAPGLVKQAAVALGVDPSRCAVIGDIAVDAQAAQAAGARAVVVPARATRPEELGPDLQVAPDLLTALDLVLGGRC